MYKCKWVDEDNYIIFTESGECAPEDIVQDLNKLIEENEKLKATITSLDKDIQGVNLDQSPFFYDDWSDVTRKK